MWCQVFMMFAMITTQVARLRELRRRRRSAVSGGDSGGSGNGGGGGGSGRLAACWQCVAVQLCQQGGTVMMEVARRVRVTKVTIEQSEGLLGGGGAAEQGVRVLISLKPSMLEFLL